MRCRSAQRMISRAIDGRVVDGDRAELERHLAVCDGCRQLQRDIQATWRAIEAFGAPADFQAAWATIDAQASRPRSRWAWLDRFRLPAPVRAAVFASFLVVAGLGVGGGLLLFRGLSQAPKPSVEAAAISDAFSDLPAGALAINVGPLPRTSR